MKLCDTCHRHVRPGEGACPFCGRSLRTAVAARLGTVVLLGALEVACSDRPIEETAGGGTSPSTGTGTSGEPTPSSGTASTSAVPDPTTGTPPAMSSSGELSSTGDIDSGDSGCSFYGGCPSDFANPVECDPGAQDCSPGQKCVPFATGGLSPADATHCVPVPRDPDKLGEPCTATGAPLSGHDSCEAGSLCWDVDPETLAGHCVALCGFTPNAQACPEDHTCLSFDPLTNLCAQRCDPLAPTCRPDELCLQHPAAGGAFVCVADGSGDGGALFQPCTALNGCDLGLACAPSTAAVECAGPASACCLPFCDLDAPACTAEGAACVPWYEPGEAPAGLEHVGLCALP